VAALAALLLVGSAVSVLAAETPPLETPGVPPATLQAQAGRLPDARDVEEGIELAEREEAARERELESPEAIEEREESRDEFADLGAAGAQELLQAFFGEQLAKLNSDPARTLGDAEVVRTLSATVATVTEDGDGALLDAGIPVRTRDEDGDLHKVDLSLEATAAGFETANALSDVSVGDTAADPVEVGEEGLSISQDGAAPSSDSRRFGDQNVFSPEALTDTDTLVSPTASGVEIFNLLRSEESPEAFRFEIDLPQGAELRPDGHGGAIVVQEGETIAAIPFPTAVDAQGTDVAVELAVQGDTIALHVPHRGADLAYPILVDPILEDWVNANQSWQNGHNLQALTNGAWQWTSEPYAQIGLSTGNPCLYTCWGRGLYVTSVNRVYGPSVYSHWSYSAPNLGSYISKAWLVPFWRDNHGCSKNAYPRPYDYDGLWDHIYNGGHWNLVRTDMANDQGSDSLESWGRALIVGMHTGSGINIPCWRDLYVGGAAVWLDDWDPPYASASAGVPSGWINDEQQITVSANTGDGGLGVLRVTLAHDGKPLIGQDNVGCTGLYGNRCPTTRTSQFKLTGGSLGEGWRGSSVTVEDPTGKTAVGGYFNTKVDYSPPEVLLDGQFAEATEDDEGAAQGDKEVEKLRLPVYSLKVEAKDGTNAGATKERRSGVKDIEVFLDGAKQTVPWSPQEPTEDSRPMTQTYQLKLSTVSTAGLHKLEVRVRDQVDNIRERTLEFEYFPATGMKDEYVMQHFPLPDGNDHSEEEVSSGPELAVNVMNGNLVYRERDVEVEGAAVDLEVERYYNSQLPEAEDTEWGDGWTLAQTPELGSPGAGEADVLDASGAIEDGVELPTEVGQKKFDPELRATFVKRSGGGYEMTDEAGESATSVAFDATGQAEALLTDGYAKVDYDYEAGALSEIAVEDPGSTDLLPDEVEEPEKEQPTPSPYTDAFYYDSFGSQGEGEGEMEAPADIARDASGNSWVVDPVNHALLKYDEDGGLLLDHRSGPGQLTHPAAVAIAPDGTVWVADSDSVLQFNGAGEILNRFEDTGGPGLREFNGAQGIAVDPEGNFWVANTLNGQLQKYDSEGEFIRAIGPGQLGEPTDVDLDGEGNVWAVDSSADEVVVFDDSGQLLLQFGSTGSGAGEFQEPNALDLQPNGTAWVGDSSNGRVQWFDDEGEYLGEFGSAGAGEGQFGPGALGLDSDGEGGVWIADGANHRLQRWIAGSYVPSEEIERPQDDPTVTLETDDGLISALEGEEAGEHSYEHEGDFLASHDGPDGETLYEKNAAGLLSKVTLPNGTWAQVEYFADNRVKSVTVKPAGEVSKTTTFEYQDATPRRTVVDPSDAPYVTYEIGADGSVLKWWNTPQSPTFDFLAGTLWDHREEENGLWPGDHVLDVQAFSAEGIASIQIIANGNQLVHETTCEQDPEVQGIECVEPPLESEWVASTDAMAPGHLQIEVIATDHAGGSASKRFWVDIPEPPPPPAPGTPTPPRFADILRFRDEYGLEKVFPVANEIERNERIFDLIKAWYEGEAVARASWERWGVPLRPQDLAEMEYREWYMAVNIPLIEEWATQNRSSTYAGYYMDHPAGGILRVGFTQDQAGALAQLKQLPGMVAVDRIDAYPATPTSARISLQATFDQVEAAWGSDPVLASLVTGTGLDERSNKVEVTGTDPVQIESRLKMLLGSGAPVQGVYEAMGEEFKPRDRVDGRIRAGDHILGSLGCSAGFGAWDRIGTKPNGDAKIAPFVMTAAHCGGIGQVFQRGESNAEGKILIGTLKKIGHVGRTAFVNGGAPFETDAALVKLNAGDLMPRYIYKDVGSLKPVEEPDRPWPGETLCFSAPGAEVTKHSCGEFVGVRVRKPTGGEKRYVLIARFAGMPGDSGGPVWSPHLERSVGIILGGSGDGKYQGWVTPLLVPRNHEYHAAKVPGALHAPGLGDFHLAVPGN
jgi:sugar lactone lactonase YvrE